jgi:hypothetical protein
MNHKFVVSGQPVPYTRTTQKSKFVSKQWKRYAEYKTKIVGAFLESFKDVNEKHKYWKNYLQYSKPIKNDSKCYILSVAYFSNKRHGDPDNCCVKSVNDSLFVSDKYVSGAFDFNYDKDNPRLEIMIFDDICEWKLAIQNIY